jgi:hypothetical protein
MPLALLFHKPVLMEHIHLLQILQMIYIKYVGGNQQQKKNAFIGEYDATRQPEG